MLKHALWLVVVVAAACGRTTPDRTSADTSTPLFDAYHSVALDGTITAGRIIASSDRDPIITGEIREQLMYTIGQLNGLNGVADGRRTEITIGEKVARTDGRWDVTYAAKLFIAWPREKAVPATLELVLPAGGYYDQLDRFNDAYGADEASGKKCMAWEAHDVTMGIFWYYYRPAKPGCSLLDPMLDDVKTVARFPVNLAVSGENTDGKSPEYGKVWEDGKLVVTAIFGKNEEGATSNWDAGIAAYRELYQDLISTYGSPVTTTLPAGLEPDVDHDDVALTFNVPNGVLDVRLFLVDGIRSTRPDFQPKYNERTKVSDFVSYSGHSGLGANIRALAGMGQFVAGQYQIFLINGCDTFAYVDGALRDAHQVVNPTFGPNKFFDIITNAMPSYFHMNSTSNMVVIGALSAKSQTYREMLAGFDQAQRANVTGEEDNLWPLPFQ